MSEWSVLGLGSDPAPGDPAATAALATRLRQEAERARSNGARLSGVAAGSGQLRMAGDYAPKYRDALTELPGEIGKLQTAYQGAGDALAGFADGLAEAKARAGVALRQGQDADGRYRGAMNELRAALPGARGVMLSSGLGLSSVGLDAATIGLDPATTATVHAAAARARAADADREAARRLADQAASLRDDSETRCVAGIQAALDGSGIKDKSWYEKAWDWASAPFRSWDDFVALCRKVAVVAGVVALLVSGPIGLALVAIALVAGAAVFADTLSKYAAGRAGLGDVGLDALGLIPGGRGVTSLAALARGTAGLLRSAPGAGRAVVGALGGIRELAPSIRGTLGDLRSSAVPFVKRVVQRDPIDVATGDMVLQQVDVDLPGTLPLLLTRTHVSSYRAGRWFGRSWASTLDQRLELDGGGAFFAGDDGVLLAFPLPPDGGTVQPAEGPRLNLSRDRGRYRITDPETGRTRHFAAAGADAGVLPLVAVEDRNGNRIDLSYDARGVLTGLRHSGGYAIGVDTAAGQVTGLRLLGADRDCDLVLIRFGYDAAGRLTSVINSSGEPLRFDYDPAGRIIAWHDRIGTSYRYTYDALGRCVATSGSAGCLDGTLHHDEERLTTTVTDSLGHTTVYQLNTDRQVIRETDPLGHAISFEWDRYDRLLCRTDALGAVTRYDYDQAGNPIRVTRPDGSTITARYNELRLPVEVTGADGATWRREYDSHGNLLAVTDPMGATTRYGYDQRGALTRAEDPTGARTEVRCDEAGLPIAVTDPRGGTTRCARDLAGRITSTIDATGQTWCYEWTPEGRPASRTSPSGLTESWTYDAEGNLAQHTDPEGRITRVDHTHFDLPADGARVVFSYDTELRLVAVTDPAGRIWRYHHDPAGRLVGEVDFDGRELSYRLDPAGRLVATVNGAGETVEYVRDAMGRPVRQACAEVVTTFEYDPAGRVTRAVNPDADVRLEYDPLGRVLAETSNGRRLSSSFDAAGRRTTRRTPSGAMSTWNYDNGLPTSLQTSAGRLEFRHDAAGREQQVHLGEHVQLTRAWDGNGRLTEQRLTARDRRLVDRQYRYRCDSYLTGITDPSAGPLAFDLDPVGRILAAGGDGRTERYGYDGAGRPNSASWTGDGAGGSGGERHYTGTRLQRAGSTRYRYDAQGRMVSRHTRTLSGQRRNWTYTWDAHDRLVAVTTPDGARWHYRYDPFGRRIAKERLTDDGAVATRVDFTWDGATLAEQAEAVTTEPVGARVTTWDWHEGTFRPVAQTRRAAPASLSPHDVAQAPQQWIDEAFHAIVTDLAGTPTELVDADGRLGWKSRGSLWGATISGGTPSTVDCPLRFPGQYADPETGLHYNYYRYYDPETARYLSPDPIGLAGGTDPHGYVHNPHHWADPLGLAPYSVAGGDLTRVGRWMGASEHDAMVGTGMVQEGAGGTSYVAHPAQVMSYLREAKSGTRYVEFDVPRSSLAGAGKEGWAQIPGPNSMLGRLAARRGEPLPQFPAATNIEWIASKL
jgi:RHS repeat-associated protein